MAHPTIENRTPFAFEALYSADEEGRPLLVTVVRATYEIAGRCLVVATKQMPVPVGGELHGESAETSSHRYEPEFAFEKPGTDVVLLGHAHAPRVGACETSVFFHVGPLEKTVHVVGDRVWVKSAGAVVMTRPLPFEKIPLIYERAFGGWDRTAGTPEKPEHEPRNPVGTGFRSHRGIFEEGIRLPNIEDPAHLLRHCGQTVPPAGFGFISPNWQPRVALAGTYDEAWSKERAPLLPRDFDRRFFNAASPGLVAPGHLRGDEPVSIAGASPFGAVSFRLPGAPPPVCRVALARGRDAIVEARLDTVVVNMDEDRVFLTWRGYTALRDGPHDVRAIAIESPGLREAAAWA